MCIKFCNGLHCNFFLEENIKAEFIHLSNKEFYTILNKNRSKIKSYIGHKQLAKRFKVEYNRENTYCTKGDMILVFCGANRKNATYRKDKDNIKMLILITGRSEYYSKEKLKSIKQCLMRGEETWI